MAKTVLIVDDVAFVRRTLSEILTEAHYQIVGEAANGQEAVQLYQKHRPNLVTMDIVMPEMSGIEATRKLLKLDKDAKVVMISAMGQDALIMEAISAGARDFILKPFTALEVLRTIERTLLIEDPLTARATAVQSGNSGSMRSGN